MRYYTVQQCIESLLTGFKLAERTDRVYSVCEMNDLSMIEINKIIKFSFIPSPTRMMSK